MNTDICPSNAKSWGADGKHLFLASASNECFYCNLKESEFLASKIGDAKLAEIENAK